EGSLSFRNFLVVANSHQYWPKRAGYAEKSHWEHGFGAVDTRDARVFSGVSPHNQLSGILRVRRTRAGGGVS
ncbi:MAG TPA: hypothetical protein VF243_08470, partial [Nitrosospira sp.]